MPASRLGVPGARCRVRLVRGAVVVMMGLGLLEGNEAAVRDFADDMLKLQGGVVDAEAFAQHHIDAVEDEVAL